MTPARLAAVRALVAIERGSTTLPAEMERARATVPGARDRGLLLEIVAGTLRWRNELDFLIDAASQRPLPDLDADVRAVLRAGAYQLRHLDRVPAHAVLHESVEITRHLGRRSASGFVNAVLRKVSARSRGPALPAAPSAADDVEGALRHGTITLSHPEWLVRRWIDRYGVDATMRWCAFNCASPELTVRFIGGASPAALVDALQRAGVDAAPARHLPDSIRLAPGRLGRLPDELQSSVMVQEEASQIVAHAVGAQPGEHVLDVCAAPGGKTLVIASDMGGSGLLVAGDRRPGRVALLRETLQRTGTRASVVAHDATRPLPFGAVFDRVLLDAPCSGLGTLRRDPDVKWSRVAEDLARFADVQVLMAQHAANAVRPGGILIYSTCSSEPEENEEVVARVLDLCPDVARQPITLGPHVVDGRRLVDADGYLRTLPFAHGLDAFFAAALVRQR